MEKIAESLRSASKDYDRGGCPLGPISEISAYALNKIRAGATWESLGTTEGRAYSMLVGPSGAKSRPVVKEWFIEDSADFTLRWASMVANISENRRVISCPPESANSVLYTAVMAIAVAFDLWKPASRKTPGTFFEMLLGSVLGRLLPGYQRSKHIPLGIEEGADPISEESVSTDIVFTRPDASRSLVIPAKITTRERIVQPFAHQRILDSKFGEGRYVSVLTCVSETQRDEKRGRANMICVPGAVRLFQQHLAKLGGIYYLDPPARYLAEDVLAVIPVGSVGQLLTVVLPTLV